MNKLIKGGRIYSNDFEVEYKSCLLCLQDRKLCRCSPDRLNAFWSGASWAEFKHIKKPRPSLFWAGVIVGMTAISIWWTVLAFIIK